MLSNIVQNQYSVLQIMDCFNDILSSLNIKNNDFFTMSRDWKPAIAYKQVSYLSPEQIKLNVFKSARLNIIIDEIASSQQMMRNELVVTVQDMLDEIGLCRNLKVIRWLGVVITKIAKTVCSGIYVNEESIKKVKACMGDNPVLFLPSHRSYADFIIMSYICFIHDLDIPAIAAGMDFHGMWGMGWVLRQTCAFFMRRSFASEGRDNLYWAVFREYVHTLVTRHHTPIEFFIEGTRSRSCKSLVPKTGLLSMALEPFFFGEVPDVTIVPITLSYERNLEENLFACELLGIPKPKESTKGFLKSLQIVKQRYGKIFIDFSTPFSAKAYFKDKPDKLNRSQHCTTPVHLQEVSQREKKLATELAYHVVDQQQHRSVLTVFNLIAISIYFNIHNNNKLLTVEDLKLKVKWLRNVLINFGARIFCDDVEKEINDTLQVHKGLVNVDKDNRVSIICKNISMSGLNVSKLKGYCLTDLTMTKAAPMIALQLYINPALYCLVGPAIITLVVMFNHKERRKCMSQVDLRQQCSTLLDIFSHEFVFYKPRESLEITKWLSVLDKLNVVKESNSIMNLGHNSELANLLVALLVPFINCYLFLTDLLLQVNKSVTEKYILSETQRTIELDLQKSEHKMAVLSYSLSLDSIGLALQMMVANKFVVKERSGSTYVFVPNREQLENLYLTLEQYLGFYHFNEFYSNDHMVMGTTSKL